jgi:hypothetical protein
MFLGGCGGGESFELAAVSGTVTMDGKPLAGVTVSYQPIAQGGKDPGAGSFGKTNEQGEFTLELINTGKAGAAVGKHRVSLTTPAPEDGGDSDVNDFVDPIPARYSSRTTLTAEVTADGTEKAEFKLTSEKDELDDPNGDGGG